MGEEIKIIDVQAENYGTLIQVDFKSSTEQGRLFIPTRDIYKALNNFAVRLEEAEMIKMGAEKIDPNAPPYGLID